MENIVLYRKYRPKTFAEVVGQEHVVRTLKNAVRMNMVSHAYLFTGPRGSGKTTIARILAKAVNCLNPKEGEPCEKCEACLEISAGRAMDLLEIDAASNRGIENMRELREGAVFAPSRLKYKVYVIDECHQLTKEAVNALLKILEEPPAHVIFILATTELHKMIPTIVSRCQRFDFKKFSLEEIVEQLGKIAKAEGVKADAHALEVIALNAGGSLRDAESIFDKVLTFHKGGGNEGKVEAREVQDLLGLVDANLAAEFAELLVSKNAKDAISTLNQKIRDGLDAQEFAKSLVRYLRFLLVVKMSPETLKLLETGFTNEQEERMTKLAASSSEEFLRNATEKFMEAEGRMRSSSILHLPLELAVVEVCAG